MSNRLLRWELDALASFVQGGVDVGHGWLLALVGWRAFSWRCVAIRSIIFYPVVEGGRWHFAAQGYSWSGLQRLFFLQSLVESGVQGFVLLVFDEDLSPSAALTDVAGRGHVDVFFRVGLAHRLLGCLVTGFAAVALRVLQRLLIRLLRPRKERFRNVQARDVVVVGHLRFSGLR